ncbi:TPA: hypothetical protein G9B72_004590 [Salmonella enterica]|uniref:Uncharacterized protein n=1 Tax=Salmonella enterica TaxID=28901 RepID=A0A743Q0Y1_SALER|nr:hypothetical protein [Salmonella enterica]
MVTKPHLTVLSCRLSAKIPPLVQASGPRFNSRHPVGLNDGRQVATDGGRPPSIKKATSVNPYSEPRLTR